MPRGDPSEYICESLVSYPDSNRKKRESEKKNSTRDKKRVWTNEIFFPFNKSFSNSIAVIVVKNLQLKKLPVQAYRSRARKKFCFSI